MIKKKIVDFFMNYSRKRKFSVIKQIVNDKSSVVLDIACGKGEFLEKIVSEDDNSRSMLDNIIALDFRREHLIDLNSKYKLNRLVVADACNLPFKDNSVDLVVSNAFLEHLPIKDREIFAAEVNRAGKNYWISTPNRFSFIEVHYYLPFIGWLKPALRDKIVGLYGREVHYDPINLLTYNELKNLFVNHTKIFTLNILGLFSHLIVIKSSATPKNNMGQ